MPTRSRRLAERGVSRGALVAVLLLAGCRFSFDRQLQPGELRGRVSIDEAIERKVTRVAAKDARVRLRGSTYAQKVDDSGRFVFRRMGAGSYSVLLEYDTDADGTPEALLSLKGIDIAELAAGASKGRPAGRDLGELLLVHAGVLEGRVVLDGAGLEGATVLVLGKDGQPDANLPLATTGADGRFRLPFVPAGKVSLRAVFEKTEGAHKVVLRADSVQPVEVAPRQVRRAEIALAAVQPARPGSVTGRVTAFDGLDGVALRLVPQAGGDAIALESFTLPHFAIPSVPAGIYTLAATAPGYEPVRLPDLVVDGDTDAGTLLFSQFAVDGARDCNGNGLPECAEGATSGCDTDDDSDGITDAAEEPACRCAPGSVPLFGGGAPDPVVVCRAHLPCEGGRCVCPGLGMCGEACVDLANDPANCGTCGRACEVGRECRAGDCVPTGGVTCPDPATCVCASSADCGTSATFACVEQKCVRLCPGAAACGAGEVCEDAVCVKPGCGSHVDCPGDAPCIAGECSVAVPDSAVASCAVLPPVVTLYRGQTKGVQLELRDAAGQLLPWNGAVMWGTGDSAVATAGGTGLRSVVIAGAAGETTVTATAAGVSCGGTARTLAQPPTSDLAVAVVEYGTGSPVSGAVVVVGDGLASQTTGADGKAFFPGQGAPQSISVFHADYGWSTHVGYNFTSYIVELRPLPRKRFTGTRTPAEFSALRTLEGTVRLATHGVAQTDPADLRWDALLGERVGTKVDLGGAQSWDVWLPGGMTQGIGDRMHRSAWEVGGPAGGTVALWALGGNATLADWSSAVTPLLTDPARPADLPGMTGTALLMSGGLQSGFALGSAASVAGPVLSQRGRLRLDVQVPRLPLGPDGQTRLPAAVVFAGIRHPVAGLLPLGASVGWDRTEAGELPDGYLNPRAPGDAKGTLRVRFAARSGGLEYAPWMLSAVAGNPELSEAREAQQVPRKPLTRSVILGPLDRVAYSPDVVAPFSFPVGFLDVPTSPSLSARRFSLGPAVTGAARYRLDIDGRDGIGWRIFFGSAQAAATFDIPQPPQGFTDRLAPATHRFIHALVEGGTADDRVIVAVSSTEVL